jgi:O-antigen/teichoic acid export membrane protein
MFQKTIKIIFGRVSINCINQFAFLITLPILANRLDFIIFGQISIVLVLMQLSWVISEWGIENFCIENFSKLKDLNLRSRFVTQVISLNLFISLFFLLLLLIFIYFGFLVLPYEYFYALIPGVILGGVYPLWFFQIMKSPQDMIYPTLFSRIIFLLIIIFFVKDNDSAIWVILAQAITLFFIVFYAFFRMRFKYSLQYKGISYKEIENLAYLCFPFFVNKLTNNQINTLWGFGLSLTGGPSAMAIFNLGDQLYRAGGSITNIIAQSVRILFINENLSKIKFTIYFFGLSYLFIALIIAFFSDVIVSYFFSHDYLPSIPILKIMILAWALHGIIKLLSFPVFGDSFGPAWVNNNTNIFFLLHFVSFFIWALFFSSAFAMSVIFSVVIFLQLVFFLFHFYRAML